MVPSTVDYDSSARACSAIFVLDPTKVNALPTPSEVRAAQERDQALQRWITHHHTSTSRFKPVLVECEDNTNVWADISVTPARILVPTTLQRVVLTVSIALLIRESRLVWPSSSVPIGGNVSERTLPDGQSEACQKPKVHKHTKAPLERLPAPPSDSVIYTWI